MKNTFLLIAALSVLGLTSCTDPPAANVLTSADPTTGMVNVGALLNFPYAGATTTVFEDTIRRKTCYVLTDHKSTSISCDAGISGDQQPMEVRLIPPPVETKSDSK